MATFRTAVFCRIGRHRWHAIRVEGQVGRECRDCGSREFDGPRGDPDVKTAAEVMGGMTGGVGGMG